MHLLASIISNRKEQIKHERRQLAAFQLEIQRQKKQKKVGVKQMVKKMLQVSSIHHLNKLKLTESGLDFSSQTLTYKGKIIRAK